LASSFGNYGWPLFSLGLDCDGTPVEYGKDLGVEFDLSDIEQGFNGDIYLLFEHNAGGKIVRLVPVE